MHKPRNCVSAASRESEVRFLARHLVVSQQIKTDRMEEGSRDFIPCCPKWDFFFHPRRCDSCSSLSQEQQVKLWNLNVGERCRFSTRTAEPLSHGLSTSCDGAALPAFCPCTCSVPPLAKHSGTHSAQALCFDPQNSHRIRKSGQLFPTEADSLAVRPICQQITSLFCPPDLILCCHTNPSALKRQRASEHNI